MPWGRGGAGNFAQLVEEANKRAAENPETSQQPALDPSSSSPAAAAAAAQPPLEYAHMGRGGAGNYYSPASLEQTGTFGAPADAGADADGASATVEPVRDTDPSAAAAAAAPDMPIARTGRGGAGNFVWRDQQSARGAVGSINEDEVRERVESDVEKGLSKPASAFLGNGKEMDRFSEGH